MGNALWAWALAFTFFMSFEGSSYWFVYPNRGRIFLRENSNGLKVGHNENKFLVPSLNIAQWVYVITSLTLIEKISFHLIYLREKNFRSHEKPIAKDDTCSLFLKAVSFGFYFRQKCFKHTWNTQYLHALQIIQ